MDRLNPCNNMDRLKIYMGKITTLIRLLICGVYLSSHLLFTLSLFAANPTSLKFVQQFETVCYHY